MLTLSSATVRVGQATLLSDVSLDVRPGEVLAVVGPNGAGKTTALRVIAGETPPTTGGATLGGRPLAEIEPRTLALRRAVMPQASTLPFDFSVLEVVLLGRTPHRAGQAADLDAAFRAMRAGGVEALAARRYQTLSGGEQQRVHLARALAQLDAEAPPGETRYLLLDEPTSALDIAHQHAVLRTARDRAAEGVGVLAVLHDLNHAAQYADRVAVLAAGRLVACGPPREVLTADVVARAFGVTVVVTDHPCAACPLVVPVPDGALPLVPLTLPTLP